MKNKEMNEQQPKAQCSICGVMRCAFKWLMAAAFTSMVILLVVCIIYVILYDEQKTPRWITIWMMSTLLTMLTGFVAALIGWFKDFSKFVRDELRCA